MDRKMPTRDADDEVKGGTKPVRLVVDGEMHKKLRFVAGMEGISMAEVARRALADYVDAKLRGARATKGGGQR